MFKENLTIGKKKKKKKNLTVKSANIVAQIMHAKMLCSVNTMLQRNTVSMYTEILNNLVGNEKHTQTKS